MKRLLFSLIRFFHNKYISNRRYYVLSKILSELAPNNSKILDIGCGDGSIGYLMMQHKPDIYVEGVEIMMRPDCKINCKIFDGQTIPMKSSSVDVCMLVDVLHHTLNIKELLKEASRISSRYIIIKDHIYQNKFDFTILKIMDWIGNRPHDVNLVYNYKKKNIWNQYFSSCQLKIVKWNENVPIHPFPINKIFSRNLHFITLMEKYTF